MKILRNLSIRNKLLLISLIPLGALFYFLAADIINQVENKKRVQQVYHDVLEIKRISDVVHQLQQERAYSLAYLTSSGKEDSSALISQRGKTDQAIFKLQQELKNQNKGKSFFLLNKIPGIRGVVNSLQTSSDSIAMVFTGINTSLIDEVSTIYGNSNDTAIRNLLETHVFLLYSEGFLGQLRMKLYLAITSGGFKNKEFADFSSIKGKFENNIQRFRKNASPELALEFDRSLSDPYVRLSQQLIDSVYNRPRSGIGFTADVWRTNLTSWLNELIVLEELSGNAIRKAAESRLDEISDALARNIIVALAVMLLISLLLYYTIGYIVSSVMKIKNAADRIAQGDLDLAIAADSTDELGILAGAFDRLIEVSKEYAEAANIIGRGDYSPVVQVRGPSDTLGLSLNNMKHNLQKLSEENLMRTWLLTGNSELNDKLRGEKEVGELAQEVISMLAGYLNAQIGALYLAEGRQLHLAGSYAFRHRKENSNALEFGEGLVGQAALEKKPIILNQVPDDYIKINSGLGNTSPKNIIIYPFLYDGQIKGIIEIGSVSEFSVNNLKLLEMVAESVGIAFNSSQSRTLLKELLEKTRKQAEELENQQEELRRTNEELQEKTYLLQDSEAELKTQQEELLQTNEELEEQANLLEEQKNRLEVAKMNIESKAQELEITNRYKSEFLANMSHELRTPLNSILILSQLLYENKNNVLRTKEVEFARNIYTSGTNLLDLINEILDLSKVESGKIELDIEEVELPEVKENMESMFREIAINKGINFKINYKEEKAGRNITTDKQRLEQILRNLLSNAFKFTDKGGRVTLEITTVTPPQRLRNPDLRMHKNVLAFEVTDTGIGIPASKQAIVFEAFQQADGSTKRKYGGTGLGLSISRELANALGGEIELESDQGKGSTFTLYLPSAYDASMAVPLEQKGSVIIKPENVPAPVAATEDHATEENVSDDRYVIRENEKVILIMEDDVPYANVLLDFIRKKGYYGIMAHQGNTGLSLARHYKPIAILLDMKLPVMDGAEVLKQLKNDPELRHIPVQIISGYDRRNEGFELGAFDFLKKPVSETELNTAFSRIEDFISRKFKKLLVVEDNRQQNMAIKELVSSTEIQAFSAYTGEEAVALMQKEKFDCIIIDLGLPGMDGIDLLEQVKAKDEQKNIPVIIYTGKELSKAEAARLSKLADTIVLKTADSAERLLDETMLFLHSIESRLPKEKQQIIRKLHRTDEVLKNKKIMIVDDDMRNIYSLTNALEDEGVRCISAENGKEALKLLNEQPDTDIILMDVMMPEMDGYEAAQEIRKMNRFAKLPVIALTARAMKGDREKCLEAGMSDYITKPVNIEQLLSLMRVWLYK